MSLGPVSPKFGLILYDPMNFNDPNWVSRTDKYASRLREAGVDLTRPGQNADIDEHDTWERGQRFAQGYIAYDEVGDGPQHATEIGELLKQLEARKREMGFTEYLLLRNQVLGEYLLEHQDQIDHQILGWQDNKNFLTQLERYVGQLKQYLERKAQAIT